MLRNKPSFGNKLEESAPKELPKEEAEKKVETIKKIKKNK